MTISTNTEELRIFTPLSRVAIAGWPAVLFSLPFLGCGGYLVLISYDILHVADANFKVPRPFIALVGALFFIAGAMVFLPGISGILRKIASQKHALEQPGDIPGADYPWNQDGIKGEGLGLVINNFFGWSFFALFMVPCHWLFFFVVKKIPGFVWPMVIIFDLVVLGGFTYCFYLLIRFLRYGQSYLKFNAFPYRNGETFSGIVIPGRPLKGVSKMKITLRFIEERFETRGSGDNSSTQVVCYARYSEVIERTDFPSYAPDISQIPVSFKLPEDITLKNDLADRPPRYWQLEVSAQTPGVDYLSHFLVPVY